MSALTEPHLRAWVETCGRLPGGSTGRAGSAVWSLTDIPWPMFNGGVGGTAAEVAEGAAALVANGRPCFWWVLDDTPADSLAALADAGLEEFDHQAPWEEALSDSLPLATIPDGVRLQEATDEAGWRDWTATLRECYGFPEVGETSWLEPARRLGWRDLPVRAWTAYDADGPVGVALLFEGAGVAGLFGVATQERARRRGIGRAVTLVPLHAAASPVAGFFSTPDGSALYRTLGFQPDGWVTRWLWMPSDFQIPEETLEIARARH